MKKVLAIAVCCGLVTTPVYARALPVAGVSAGGTPSLLEAAETAAASGVYRAQNLAGITTGKIRAGDKKRSAIAYGLSGLMAFAGAALWRWLPCRNIPDAPTNNATENAKYYRCYEADGQRKGLETPTKAMLGAGVTLEVVSLFYWIAHLREDDTRQTP